MVAISLFVLAACSTVAYSPITPIFAYNVVLDRAVLTGVTPLMEYRVSTSLTWTVITGTSVEIDIPDANTTYHIRTRGVSLTQPASNFRSVTLLTRSATLPTATLNYQTESITGLHLTTEYRVNGGMWNNVTGTTMSIVGLYGTT